MNVRVFEYLALVDKCRSFSSAARELHVTPQAVSGAIHNLERELGIPLIDASKKGAISLTDYGRAILGHARRIRGEIAAVRCSVEAIKAHRDNIVKLGCATGVIGYLGEDFLDPFDSVTGCRVLVSEELPDVECTNRLVAGEYDIALLTTPPACGCLCTEIVRDHHFLWINNRDPLSRKPEVRLEDLDGRAVAAMNESYHYTSLFLDRCNEAGVRPKMIFSGEMIRVYELARLGRAIGITCRNHVEATSDSSRTVGIPFRDLPWGIYACWSAKYPMGETTSSFLEFMRGLQRSYD